jgi:membrane associated rhomboid family serine protease
VILGLQHYYYPILYFAALIVANIPTYLKHRDDYNYRSLGASGAVCAVLFAFILMRPWDTDRTFCHQNARHHLCLVIPGLFHLYVQTRRETMSTTTHISGARCSASSLPSLFAPA